MINDEYMDYFDESHSQPTESLVINHMTSVEKKEKNSFTIHTKCEYELDHSWSIMTDTENETIKWINFIEKSISKETAKNKSPTLLKETRSFYEKFDLSNLNPSGYIRKIDKLQSQSTLFPLIFRKVSSIKTKSFDII